jgi:hypothetical protein
MEKIEFALIMISYFTIWIFIYFLCLYVIYKTTYHFTKDKDTSGTVFILFWVMLAIIIQVIALSLMDNIVLWINNPWLNNMSKECIIFN